MDRLHLTEEDLRVAVERERSEGELQLALQHMLTCEHCRSLLSGLSNAQRDVLEVYLENRIDERLDSRMEMAYSKAIDRAFRSVLAENGRLERERERAPDLLSELRKLPLEQGQLLVQNSPRYRTWGLTEQLLQACRAGWTDNPARSQDLALLALTAAAGIEASGFRAKILNDLKAEAWSFVANCQRIRGDLAGAEVGFREAESYLSQGTGDSMERAQLLNFRFSLARAKREFALASRLLEQAITIYREAGDRHMEGRALIQKAKLCSDSGRAEEAIPVLEQSLTLIDSCREPELEFLARKNLVVHKLEIGEAREAQALLPGVRDLARKHGSRLERLRLLWSEGLVCRGLGQVEFAEEAFKQVREGFIAAGIGYDVALVSLDLATLYLESGRTAEVKQLAAEMLPIFASLQIHREAIMAWTVFRQAVEQEVATVRVIEEVAARIRDVQGRPAPSNGAL